jgi:hypothetical protein
MVDFVLEHLKIALFILMVYKCMNPTIYTVHPPTLRISAHATIPGWSFPKFLFHALEGMGHEL